MRDSFVFYRSFREAIDETESEEARLRLYDIITDYALDGKEPADKNDRILFKLFKSQIDKSYEKYLKRCEANRENGKKGGRPPKGKEEQENPNNPNNPMGYPESLENQHFSENPKNPKNPTKPKKPDNDNYYDYDNYYDDEDEDEREGAKAPAHSPERVPFGKHQNVFLTMSEWQALNEDCDFVTITRAIEDVSEALRENPLNESEHFQAVLDQIRKERR